MSEFENVMFPAVEAYAEEHTSPEPPLLAELSRETRLKMLAPRMLSGRLQGQFLHQLCLLKKPMKVLEVGTFTGYSAIYMALALQEEARLFTIEANPEHQQIIEKYIAKAGLQDKINLLIGDAKDLIPTLDCTFDLIYLDADKNNYPIYYELLMAKLNSGGLLIADNVLWSGKVLEKSTAKDVLALQQFNDLAKNDERVSQVLLPFRDGIMMIIKK